HPPTERDPTEPLPRDRIRHLPAHRLEPEPIPVLQKHQTQVRLDRDRRPTMGRVEERHERREEPLIIEESVDPLELGWHHQRLGRQQRFPQRWLTAYRSQHSMAPIRSTSTGWSHRTTLTPSTRAPSPGVFQGE